MRPEDRMRAALNDAVSGPGDLSPAERLCHACVDLLTVDGAALSLMHEPSSRGTVGASGDLSRRLDELQFTFGEGPCFESMRTRSPVLVSDVTDPREQRWPILATALAETGVRAVYALPVSVASSFVGVLDLFRTSPGQLEGSDLIGGLVAAELAAVPLLDLMSSRDPAATDPDATDELAELDRVEVYQATGMIMGQLECSAADALVRLRAHAFAQGLTAREVARLVVGRRLALEADPHPRSSADGGAA